MNEILESAEQMIGLISSKIWPVFLPFMLAASAYISIKTIFQLNKKTTRRSPLHLKNVIGPASVSLGAMIGTGAIIGVLGSLSNLAGQGQTNFEAIAIWALIGSVIMIPLSYSETVNSKVMKKMPREYISDFLGRWAGFIFAAAFAALYIFGFGGFQFSGIDAVVSIVAERFAGTSLSEIQRYVFVIIPVILIAAIIVLSRKHNVFMKAMTYMIFVAVVCYFAFFIFFIARTNQYIPTYFARMTAGMRNPVNAMFGIPLGLILGMQRVLQTAETGLGAMAMAAVEADTEPREAGLISLVPTIITVFVSIFVTSYVASYGVSVGTASYPADSIGRLGDYIRTAVEVTGYFGLVVLCLFTVLSALTTLLGSYFFLSQLFSDNENRNIVVYLIVIILAGTLAVFGLNIVFDAVDLLLFLVAALNVAALTVYVSGPWKKYRFR